jgi:DNA-binding PadR family transcriptional regulator
MDNRYLEVCVQEVVLALLAKEPSHGYHLNKTSVVA